MYNDFKIIDNEKMQELKNAYNNKLLSIKSLNLNENDFSSLLTQCIQLLENSKHYLQNLIKQSKNLENLQKLKEINENLLKNIEDIENLYNLNVHPSNIEFNNGHSNNIVNLIACLIEFLEKFYSITNLESNIKIKVILENILHNTFTILKKINALNLNVLNYKVFSLFKKNF